jgi:hypothetical protein
MQRVQILHAHWTGQAGAWHAAEPRKSAWVEPAIYNARAVITGWHLYYYRLRHRLTLVEMVSVLDHCVSATDLRAIELGRLPVPAELTAWSAGPAARR